MVPSAEDEFSYQVDRMTHLWTVSLSPQPSLSLPYRPRNKVAVVAEMGICVGSTTWAAAHLG